MALDISRKPCIIRAKRVKQKALINKPLMRNTSNASISYDATLCNEMCTDVDVVLAEGSVRPLCNPYTLSGSGLAVVFSNEL